MRTRVSRPCVSVFGSPFFAAIFFVASAVAASAQTTVTLSAPGTQLNADMTIEGGASALTDFSNSTVLASKSSSSDTYDRRIMLKFDTQNYIPANAVIASAKLQLVLKAAESSASRPLTAYYVTKSFVDGETNWHYYRSGQAWSTAGGDLGASFGTTYVANAVGSTYTFDLTKLVQKAVNGEFGSRYTRVALVDMGGADSNSYREFHSSRSTSTSLRPRLVVTYSTSGSSPAPAPSVSSTSGATLKVMQWNIHNTKGSDGVCNPDRVASAIVKQNPQVVSLNEVKFFAGACSFTFDMAVKMQSLLQQKTGATWYLKSVNADGSTGNALLSRLPLVTSSSHLLSNGRAIAEVGVVVNGRTINLFSEHVEYDTASWRTQQIKEGISWMTGFSQPRIVMGDFNTSPGTSDYNLMATPYQDAWAAAKSAGTATSYNGSGATHGASRFDYVFYTRTSTLGLKSVTVPDTRVNGVYPSDHDPVVAVFSVN